MGAPKGSLKSVHFLRVFGVPFLRVFVSLDRECDLQRPFGSDKLVFFYLAFLKRVPMVVKQSFVVFPTRLNRLKPQDSELAKCNFPKFPTSILQLSTRETDPETPVHPQTSTRLPSIDIPAPERSDRNLKIFDFPKFSAICQSSRLWLTHFQIDLHKAVPDLTTSIPSGNKS